MDETEMQIVFLRNTYEYNNIENLFYHQHGIIRTK